MKGAIDTSAPVQKHKHFKDMVDWRHFFLWSHTARITPFKILLNTVKKRFRVYLQAGLSKEPRRGGLFTSSVASLVCSTSDSQNK